MIQFFASSPSIVDIFERVSHVTSWDSFVRFYNWLPQEYKILTWVAGIGLASLTWIFVYTFFKNPNE